MPIFKIREPGESSWYEIEARDMYSAAEVYCESSDESGKAFSDGLHYEILDGDKIRKVHVTASVSYSAYDVEES